MSDNQGNQQEEFGISSETTSKSRVNFKGGFNKAVLSKVESREIDGKNGEKYRVLDFSFTSQDGLGTFTHREFIPKGKGNATKTEAEDYNDRKNRFNSRVKHIWEAFAPFPADGIGKGATSWPDLFEKIAVAFNTGNEGKPIYAGVLVWTKNTFTTGGVIQFPLIPNFVERVAKTNEQHPRTLEINKKWDIVQQPNPNANTGGTGNVMGDGGAGTSGTNQDFGF